MKNTYVYVPDEATLTKVKSVLDNHTVHGSDICVIHPIQNKDSISVETDSNILETRDVIPAILRGALAGFVISLITCTGIYVSKIDYIAVTLNTFTLYTVLFMLLGAFFSSLIGVSVQHPDVQYFDNELKKGGFLIVFKVKTRREALRYKKYLTENYNNVKVLVDDFFKISTITKNT